MSKKDKRDEIKFGPKTDVGLHRRFAEKEGLSICELHQNESKQNSQSESSDENQADDNKNTSKNDGNDENQEDENEQNKNSNGSDQNPNIEDVNKPSDQQIQAEAILNSLKTQEKINQKQKLLKVKARKLEKDW